MRSWSSLHLRYNNQKKAPWRSKRSKLKFFEEVLVKVNLGIQKQVQILIDVKITIGNFK